MRNRISSYNKKKTSSAACSTISSKTTSTTGNTTSGMVSSIVNVAVLLVLVFFVFLTACSWKIGDGYCQNKPVEVQEFIMGTIITQQVYGKDASIAIKEATDRLKEIESKMTVNSPNSELNVLNKMAGKGTVSLSLDTIYVLKKAKEFSQLTHGAFDPTLGPIIKAWGISTDKQRVPGQQEIKDLLSKVNYEDLIINGNISSENINEKKMDVESNKTVELKEKVELKKVGQSIDLGGIAKGYAGDEAIKIYKKHGIESAYINLGGNVVVLGKKPNGKPWKIGIQNQGI